MFCGQPSLHLVVTPPGAGADRREAHTHGWRAKLPRPARLAPAGGFARNQMSSDAEMS